MKAVPRALWLLAGLLPLTSFSAAAQSNELYRSVSASRQFICYAPNLLLSPALGVFADQVKREWLRALNLEDEWRDPVIIVVQPRTAGQAEASTPSVRVYRTDFHLKYQLTWLTPPLLDQSVLVVALVESLCAEYANRRQPVTGAASYQPASIPAWLAYGLGRLVQGRDEQLVQLARRSRAGGRPTTAAQLLAGERAPEDTEGRQLLEANSAAFVQSLLGLPDGPAKFQQFLAALGARKTVAAAFWTTYRTDFADEPALERWWAVQFANRTTAVVAQNFTGEETAQRLDAILTTTLAVATTNADDRTQTEVPLKELARYAKESWLADIVEEKLGRLANLRAQGSPHYRPVVEAYMDALQWLANERVSRFRHALKGADKLRAKTAEESQGIRSYLDAAEAKYAPLDWAPDFSSAFRTLSQVEAIEQSRRTPISDYLDQFDR